MWHHHNYQASAEMRKKYIPFEKVISFVDLDSSDVIMDIGGGDGFYSKLFGEKCSKVYYVDASNPAIELIKEKLSDASGNIEVIQEDVCSMKLPNDMNKVFFSNSFHDVECRENLIDKLTEASGKPLTFILIEFKKKASFGPPEYIKIGQDELDNIFRNHGYNLEKRELFQEHYISSYTKNTSER